jgi:hypothetical protein
LVVKLQFDVGYQRAGLAFSSLRFLELEGTLRNEREG